MIRLRHPLARILVSGVVMFVVIVVAQLWISDESAPAGLLAGFIAGVGFGAFQFWAIRRASRRGSQDASAQR